MKRIIGLVVWILCVCMACACCADGIKELPYTEMTGGMTSEGAKYIPETKYGQLLKDNTFDSGERWYELEVPANGNYVISIMPLGGQKQDKGYYSFYLCDERRKAYQALDSYSGTDRYISSVQAKKGENVYISIQRYIGWDCEYLISICFDGYHMPAAEGELARSATCKEEGKVIYPCLLCGYTAKTESLPKLPHTPGEWKIQSQPTCTQDGMNAQTCTVCDETIQSEAIPATGHGRAEAVMLKQPTCTGTGENAQKCSVCGAIISSVEIPALGHAQTAAVVTAEATCLNAGVLATKCVVCQEVLATENIPQKTEHTLGMMQTVRAATCTADGRGEQRCTVCNVLIREETTTALGHSYCEWMTVAEPTKDQEGQRARYCAYCGHTQTELIEKLPKVLGIF